MGERPLFYAVSISDLRPVSKRFTLQQTYSFVREVLDVAIASSSNLWEISNKTSLGKGSFRMKAAFRSGSQN